jgi:hypothetical protein
VLPNPDGSDRLAYLNFKNDNCAKTVRHTMIKRLQSTLGPDIKIDPSGVLRFVLFRKYFQPLKLVFTRVKF